MIAPRQSLHSALYECRIRHERLGPRPHAFHYRAFYLALDLDELPRLAHEVRRLRINARGVLSFWDRDYFPVHAPRHPAASGRSGPPAEPLKRRVLRWCAEHGHAFDADAQVLLVTVPRILGYHFNPVSFYYCLDPRQRRRVAIAEVTNTFRETKIYLVPPAANDGPAFATRTAKDFYVSPFSRVDGEFAFLLRAPEARLALRVDSRDGDRGAVHSTLIGERRPLTDTTLRGVLFRHPALSARIMLLIHWQALRLAAKRVPYFAKRDRPEHQRDLYRPHASLRPKPS